MSKFYISTPIYYVNAQPHIGTAYTTIAGDVLARYHRMKGDDVFYLTGTDEHGQKIARTAQEKGITPKQLADSLIPKFQETWQLLNISNDYFIRTTDPKHEAAVQALFRKIFESGDIYQGKYQGWYCTPCERYLLKDEAQNSTSVKPLCPGCKRPAEYLEETNYFFKLSKYQKPLEEYLKKHPDFIRPESRYNEMKNRLEMGVEDVSISRSAFDWGVRLPNDSSQVIWVWFDALINYISAIGYPDDTKQFKHFWPADIHLIAKDILWFHTVIWPAMLLSGGLELPHHVYAHGWWTMDSEKISKSKGNVVYPHDVVARVGVDGVRYFMLREIPFGLDGDFNYQALLGRYNSELGNDLGNLLLRTLTMIEKYSGSRIPPPAPVSAVAEPLRNAVEGLKLTVDKELGQLQFSIALEKIWEVIKKANQYIDQTKPWALAKNSPEQVKPVLYTLAESIRIIAVYLAPFIPATSQSILQQIGVWDGKETDTYKIIPPAWQIPKALDWGQIKENQITKSKPLFPRVE